MSSELNPASRLPVSFPFLFLPSFSSFFVLFSSPYIPTLFKESMRIYLA